MVANFGCDFFHLRVVLRWFQFVDFVCNNDDVFVVLHEGVEHFDVACGWAERGVDDEHDFFLFVGRFKKIPVEQLFERRARFVREFRVAVARKVDEIECFVDQK